MEYAFRGDNGGTVPYTKTIRDIGEVDVLVAGGGPSGIAAAIAAARSGSRTLLIEKNGFLGGMWTAALVLVVALVNDRTGALVIRGLAHEFLERMKREGGLLGNPLHQVWNPIDPEVAKFVADQMVIESDIKIMFHTFIMDTLSSNGKIDGVVVVNKEGLQLVRAKAFIDCTGDADLAHWGGSEVFVEPPGSMQPMTTGMRIDGVSLPGDRARLANFPFEKVPEHLRRAYDEACSEHGNPPGQSGLHVFPLPGESEFFVNKTRVPGDATKIADLTNAEVESRRQASALIGWYREHIPGFEKARLLQTGSQVGVRETRRIRGEYVLTGNDVLHCKKHDDSISRGHYWVDLHRPDSGRTDYTFLPDGDYYSVPFRSLYSRSIPNLLVAGRAISGTHEAAGSFRVTSHCMATGQAAGTAAAMMVTSKCSNRDLDVTALQVALKESDALI